MFQCQQQCHRCLHRQWRLMSCRNHLHKHKEHVYSRPCCTSCLICGQFTPSVRLGPAFQLPLRHWDQMWRSNLCWQHTACLKPQHFLRGSADCSVMSHCNDFDDHTATPPQLCNVGTVSLTVPTLHSWGTVTLLCMVPCHRFCSRDAVSTTVPSLAACQQYHTVTLYILHMCTAWANCALITVHCNAYNCIMPARHIMCPETAAAGIQGAIVLHGVPYALLHCEAQPRSLAGIGTRH